MNYRIIQEELLQQSRDISSMACLLLGIRNLATREIKGRVEVDQIKMLYHIFAYYN